MKATILLLLFITQVSYTARNCESYIPDEWPNSRYTIETVSGDNIVTDHKTGLVWKQCSEGLSGTECMTSTATTHTWQQSLDLADAQNISGYAGYTDWRLPNVEELISLAAIYCYNPSINENAFPNTTPNWFWLSSPITYDDSIAWFVNFNEGYGSFTYRDHEYHVRLVRSDQ